MSRYCLTVWALVISTVCASVSTAETVQYWVDVDNTWSEETHPGLFPVDAHFSWFGGGVHNGDVRFWDVGELASPGMVRMAETGVTTTLFEEVTLRVRSRDALVGYDIHHWFCPSGTTHSSCGETSILIRATDEFSQVTLVSMLGPSPDWFVGTSGEELRQGDMWLDDVVVDLFPYDGGTRSANVWNLHGPTNNPPEPISLITTESGQLVGPQSLGTMTFRRVETGDLNADGLIDAADIDELSAAVRNGTDDLLYDLNDDGVVNGVDRSVWVHDVAKTHFGDANLDGVFNEGDFVDVFIPGEYLDELIGNSTWATGDWNGDREFNEDDIVAAFIDGGYVIATAVPEPHGVCLLCLSIAGLLPIVQSKTPLRHQRPTA